MCYQCRIFVVFCCVKKKIIWYVWHGIICHCYHGMPFKEMMWTPKKEACCPWHPSDNTSDTTRTQGSMGMMSPVGKEWSYSDTVVFLLWHEPNFHLRRHCSPCVAVPRGMNRVILSRSLGILEICVRRLLAGFCCCSSNGNQRNIFKQILGDFWPYNNEWLWDQKWAAEQLAWVKTWFFFFAISLIEITSFQRRCWLCWI